MVNEVIYITIGLVLSVIGTNVSEIVKERRSK